MCRSSASLSLAVTDWYDSAWMEDGLGCCTLMMMGGGGEVGEEGSCSLEGRGVVVLPFLSDCGGGERRRGDTGHFVLSLNSDDCAGFCGAGGAWT